MTNESILTVLAKKPGAIAAELGATSVEMNRLFKDELIVKVGKRKTGTRGRPPVEWALPGDKDKVPDSPDPETSISIPKLPDVPQSTRDKASGEEPRMLEFIEKVFAGKCGIRELEDYRVLQKRYKDILRQISRRGNQKNLILTQLQQEAEEDE